MDNHRPGRRGLVWPIILIGLGIILLLQNFGLMVDVWFLVTRFWPVVLILVGLELLLNRTSPWLATGLALALMLVVIVGGVTASATGNAYRYVDYSGDSSGGSQPQRLAEPLGATERATVDLQFGAGDLHLNSLPSESESLMEGEFEHPGSDRAVSHILACPNGDCTLRLAATNQPQQLWPLGSNGGDNWNVALTPRIPLDLRVRSGASRLDLDLSGLQVSALRMDVGASSGVVKLPQAAGKTTGTVKLGAADLTIEVPPETAARIHTRGGLTSFEVDESRFSREGDYYVTPGFDEAANSVDLDVEAGVASVKIR